MKVMHPSKRDDATNDRNPAAISTPQAVALLALALALSTPFSGLQAAERTIAPDIRVGGHIDDNARLREGEEGPIEISGGFVDLALLGQWRTPTSVTQFRPRVRSARYPGR